MMLCVESERVCLWETWKHNSNSALCSWPSRHCGNGTKQGRVLLFWSEHAEWTLGHARQESLSLSLSLCPTPESDCPVIIESKATAPVGGRPKTIKKLKLWKIWQWLVMFKVVSHHKCTSPHYSHMSTPLWLGLWQRVWWQQRWERLLGLSLSLECIKVNSNPSYNRIRSGSSA